MDWQIGWKILKKPAQWKEGWGTVPLLSPSPSPCLDFEESESERRMYIYSISLEGNVCATTYEEGKTDATWFRVVVCVCVCVFGFNVAFNNFSVISRRCLVVTGSSMLTFIVLPH